MEPKQKLLFYGEPGCGKTLAAERIGWDLRLPLAKVKLDNLIDSGLGETNKNINGVFEYCKRYPCVMLIDECDSIFQARELRGGGGAENEMNRATNMFLQLLDEYRGDGVLIATTNYMDCLDKAIFRRFDEVIEFPLPGLTEREEMIKMTLGKIPVDKSVSVNRLARRMKGYSHANIVSAVQKAARMFVLSGEKAVTNDDFKRAMSETFSESDNSRAQETENLETLVELLKTENSALKAALNARELRLEKES